MKRQFKGVWIPAHIMEDRTLTAVDKIILADIDSFTGQGATFFKCNDTIAKEQGCAVSTVKRSVSKLLQRNLVQRVSFDGRSRHLRSLVTLQPAQSELAGGANENQQGAENAPIVKQESKQPTLTSKTLDFGALDSEAFRVAWQHWKDYKRDEHRFKFKSATTEQTALHKLIKDTNGNQTSAIAAITDSIANGWKGLFISNASTQRDRPSDANATLDWAGK